MNEVEKRGSPSSAVGDTAREDADRVKGRLEAEREAGGRLAGEARSAAGDLAARAKDQAVAQGEQMQEAAAGHLRNFAEAVRHAGDELAEKEPGAVSDVVRQAAHGLEQFSDSLARRSPAEMIDTVRDFGRRNPVGFLAGSMLAGFALARFAASSANADRSGYGSGGQRGTSYGSGTYGGAGYGGAGYPGGSSSAGAGGFAETARPSGLDPSTPSRTPASDPLGTSKPDVPGGAR